jgi:predicted negative regulator of RcsB-dependent stress response
VAEKKLSRKELLREPDEFITFSGKMLQYGREHTRVVAILVIILVICVIGAAGVYTYQKQRKDQSHEMFEQAYRNYRAVTLSSNPPSKEQLEQVFKQFDGIAKEYGSLLSGEMALLYSGHVLYKMKDFKGALERYEKMKSTHVAQSGLSSMLKYHIAMTYFALKDYEQAKSLFEQLSQNTDSPYLREAYASIAAIYEATDKKKEAVQAYRQYLKMFPQAPDAAYVRARIARLTSSG